jgi:hypothetical protein
MSGRRRQFAARREGKTPRRAGETRAILTERRASKRID